MSDTQAVVMVGMASAASALLCYLLARLVRPFTPREILRRLRSTGTPYSVRARGYLHEVWNPAGSMGNNTLFGPGTATYWLETDADAGEVIHLDFAPDGDPVQRLSAPTPERFRMRTSAGDRSRWLLPSTGFLLGGQLLSGLVGAGVAAAWASGETSDVRGYAIVGAFLAGLTLPILGILTLFVGQAVWATARSEGAEQDR